LPDEVPPLPHIGNAAVAPAPVAPKAVFMRSALPKFATGPRAGRKREELVARIATFLETRWFQDKLLPVNEPCAAAYVEIRHNWSGWQADIG
jgi:hypothetical protein